MMNNNPNDDNVKKNDESANVSKEKKSNENITFYYDREERLKKLKTLIAEKKHSGFFKKGNKRTLLIILADVLIISLFIYLINKPVNFYQKKDIGTIQYEMNITRIKGRKVMFSLTITNNTNSTLKIPKNRKIVLSIEGDKHKYFLKKSIGENTFLKYGESTSVVFMLKEKDLPRTGTINVYIDSIDEPIFSTKIRFYYFNF